MALPPLSKERTTTTTTTLKSLSVVRATDGFIGPASGASFYTTHTHTHAKSERRRIYTGRVSNAQRYDITVACVYIISPNNIIIFDTISPSAKYNISRVSYTHLCYIMLHVVAVVKCLDSDVIFVSIDSFSPIYSRMYCV